MKTVNIVLVGFGQVGRALFDLLREKTHFYERRYGLRFRISTVFRKKGARFPSAESQASQLLPGFWDPDLELASVLESQASGILVECAVSSPQTGQPGLGMMSQALERGWHVVTADKGPLAAALRRLQDLAAKNGCCLKYSGAAAAALPALDVVLYSLAGTEIRKIEGILSGTCNYILSHMKTGLDYRSALRKAQDKGIAEPDPRQDVEGWDTAIKLLLLTNAALDRDFTLNEVEVRGITRLPASMIQESGFQGKSVKLLGRMFSGDSGVTMEVLPVALERAHPLYAVEGAEKGITFETDSMGTVTVIGGKSDPQGAAAAVLKDIINIHRDSETVL